jgi:hypothetical protein
MSYKEEYCLDCENGCKCKTVEESAHKGMVYEYCGKHRSKYLKWKVFEGGLDGGYWKGLMLPMGKIVC